MSKLNDIINFHNNLKIIISSEFTNKMKDDIVVGTRINRRKKRYK